MGYMGEFANEHFPHFPILSFIGQFVSELLPCPRFLERGGRGEQKICQQPTFVPLGSIFNLPSFRPDIRASIVIFFGKQIVKM
jgi:hypothetical protein